MKNREDNILWKALLAAQRAIILVTAVGVTAIVGGACILRAFGINFIGFEEILIIVVFWLYMTGCSYGTFEKSQITADILEVMLPETLFKKITKLARYALTFLLCIVFTYWGFMLAMWTIQMDTRTPVFRIPVATGQISIFIGLLISSFYNLVYFIDEIKLFCREMREGKKGSPALVDKEGGSEK
ncbi:TRAP transporter small permease subunit [Anaerotignum sp.]|uniref:TRAP transporter small permease n=1 Tax=Anaerotignum sp. TaxID=2039241 RepID=UPI003322DE9B